MPSRNRLKNYVENSFYHIYNRGVAKQVIFPDTQDYKVFLKYLKDALSKPQVRKTTFSLRGRSFQAILRPLRNFEKEITLMAFCLMPNHFHFLIKQKGKKSLEGFMRSLITRYAQYFNKKYDRVGPVFQGRYKAVLITKDDYLLHLTRYIHLNPMEHTRNILGAYSSYPEYLGLKKTLWIKPDFVLKYFNNTLIPELKKFNSYKSFVENHRQDSKKILGNLTLD